MKKKLVYFFIIICTALLVLYLYRYRQALNFEHKIPIAATEIVQVNIRSIEHHLLVDAIKNPLKYFSFKAKKKTVHTSFKGTIVIPKNVFFYTNTSNFKNAWFSSVLKLKDSNKLRSYLLQEGFKEFKNSKLTLYTKSKATIAVANKKVLFVYQQQPKVTLNEVIESIFKETKFYKKNNKLLQSIANSKSDITYTSLAADFLTADLKNGLLEIKGKVQSNLFLNDTYSEDSENSIGFLAAKVNKNHPIFRSFLSDKNKTVFKDFTKLSLDSIVDKWNGSVLADLKTIETKTDTIVTYDYDDDFNKIEKKSIQELNIPRLSILLGNKANLYGYFNAYKAIQIIENDTLFTSIPLYKMYAEKQKNSVHIYTSKKVEIPLLKEKTYKLSAYIAIDKYLEKPLVFSSIPIKEYYLQVLKNASAKLTTTNDLLIQVKLKDDSRNFIGQFIKP